MQYYSSSKQQFRNESLVQHKTKPCFLPLKEKEFKSPNPCKICFPRSNSNDCLVDELGVQNLFNRPSNNSSYFSRFKILKQYFLSVQVHWGQVEKLSETYDVPRIFIVYHQNQWDALVISYTLLAGPQVSVKFMNQYHWDRWLCNLNYNHHDQDGNHASALFINIDNSTETHLGEMIDKLCKNESPDVCLIPVSISYEFSTEGNGSSRQHLKPNIRVNFGLPHSLKDFVDANSQRSNVVTHLKKHLIHEIWKITSIMSVHLLSMLAQNLKKSLDVGILEYKLLMEKFRKGNHVRWDMGFVGNIDNIVQYSQDILALKGTTSPSVAVDILKHESLMMKSLLTTINFIEMDPHMDTYQVNQAHLLEKYRLIARILRYEIEFLHPPCMEPSLIEKNALESLMDSCVLSQKSDEPSSEEHQIAKKIALHMDLDLEDEDEYLSLPEKCIFLFVNVAQALSRKWVASIASRLLNIYYCAARKLLELRILDGIDEISFISCIVAELSEKYASEIPEVDMKIVVRNAIKLFTEEGIIEQYIHSSVKILYLKKMFDIGDVLRLIDEIAQFC